MSSESGQVEHTLNLLLSNSEETLQSSLTTDFFGSVLYSQHTFLGRSWQVAWSFVDTVTGGKSQHQEQALKVHFLGFEKKMKSLALDLKNLFVTHLAQFSKAKEESLEIALYRRKIEEHISSYPSLFTLNMPSALNEKIGLVQRVFHKVMGKNLFTRDEERVFYDFQKLASLTAVEGVLQCPFPVSALEKLMHGQHTEAVDAWLLKVKEKENELSASLFHEALKACVMHMLQKEVSADELVEKVATLELELIKKKCSLLLSRDPFYGQWLQGIAPHVSIGGVELGRQVVLDCFKKAGFFVFEIQGNSKELAVFSRLECLLGMWKVRHVKFSSMIPSVKIIRHDPEGRFLIIEKIEKSLDKIQWISRFGGLQDQDTAKADEISRLISFLSMQKNTPKSLSAKDIFVLSSPQGEEALRLCTFMPQDVMTHHSFDVLQKLVLDTAKNSHIVFRYIMRTSNLLSHPVAKFYLEIVEEHLHGTRKNTLSDKAVIAGIVDPDVIVKAEKIILKTGELAHELFLQCSSLLKNQRKETTARLKEEIAFALIAFQKDAGIAPCNWKGAETILIEYIKSEAAYLFSSQRLCHKRAVAPPHPFRRF